MAERTEHHALRDSQIAEFWPDHDSPEGRQDIRRQFDALMDAIARTPRRQIPRFPDLMAGVVSDKTRPLSDRIALLEGALANIPEFWNQYQWRAQARPVFGDRLVYGDNGRGQGRQVIAAVPAKASYFGSIADFIAAANPDTVSQLLARIDALERENLHLRAGRASTS